MHISETNFPLISEDLERFMDAENETYEEKIFTLDGKEITDEFAE